MPTNIKNSRSSPNKLHAGFSYEHRSPIKEGVLEVFGLSRKSGPTPLSVLGGELILTYMLVGVLESSATGAARPTRNNFITLADLIRETAIEQECWEVADRAGKLYEDAVRLAPSFSGSAKTLTDVGDTLPSFVNSSYLRTYLMLVADQRGPALTER